MLVLNPAGTQPLASFEPRLMYEPTVTTTWFGFFGSTTPTG